MPNIEASKLARRELFLETTITITKLQHSTYVRYTYSVYETENEDLGGLWKTG